MAKKEQRLCQHCKKRPARAAVLNMNYTGSHRYVFRKGHSLCSECWRNLRNSTRWVPYDRMVESSESDADAAADKREAGRGKVYTS